MYRHPRMTGTKVYILQYVRTITAKRYYFTHRQDGIICTHYTKFSEDLLFGGVYTHNNIRNDISVAGATTSYLL